MRLILQFNLLLKYSIVRVDVLFKTDGPVDVYGGYE